MLLGGVRAGADGRGAHADGGGEVGHAAHDGDAGQRLLDLAGANAGRHADDEGLGVDGAGELLEDLGQDLRLDGQHDDLGALGGLAVAGDDVDAELLGEGGGAARVARHELRRRRPLLLQQPAHDGAAHAAAANDGEALGHASSRRASGL